MVILLKRSSSDLLNNYAATSFNLFNHCHQIASVFDVFPNDAGLCPARCHIDAERADEASTKELGLS
jgi:hypothetical protein